MERIAIISDIHGNMPALEAVLNDIQARGIERMICLGDLVGKGPDSELAVDHCRQVCEATVKGNWDDLVVTVEDSPVLEWHRERLGAERLAYLDQLPNCVELLVGGRQVRLFHASQIGIYHRVHMDDTRANQLAMFENTPFTGDGRAPDVVGYGDIHSAYVKCFRQRILFNAGSVGNPLDLPQAAYAVLEGARGDAPAPFSVQIVRVPYDIERAIRDAREAAMPALDEYIDELRTARYRGLRRAHPDEPAG
jgi:predicted phosphodiesterase